MKNLKTELIALCDYASVSQEGKLSINGIFDQFNVEKFPIGFIEKFLVVVVNGKDDQDYKISIKMHRNDNRQNLLNPMLFEIHTSPNGKHNMLIKLQNVAFEKDGDYSFTVYNDNEEIGSTVLKVQEQSQQPAFRVVN